MEKNFPHRIESSVRCDATNFQFESHYIIYNTFISNKTWRFFFFFELHDHSVPAETDSSVFDFFKIEIYEMQDPVQKSRGWNASRQF